MTALHSPEAEQQALGAMLVDGDLVGRFYTSLKPEDFHSPQHRAIYEALLALYDESGKIDEVLVQDRLEANTGALVGDIADALITTANADQHVTTIRDYSVKRQLLKLGADISKHVPHSTTPVKEIIRRVELKIMDIQANRGGSGLKDGNELADEVENFLGRESTEGIPTGIGALDRLTRGFHDGNLVILAARPAVGKTALAMSIVANAMRLGHRVAVYNMEMTSKDLTINLLANLSNVPRSTISSRYMTDEQMAEVKRAFKEIRSSKLIMSEGLDLSITELRSEIRRTHKATPLGLVVIDYLQLMESDTGSESRQQAISKISRGLKSIAREVGIPILALSQLNRGSENRENTRPRLSDIRESGSIEQDADLVMLLHREKGPDGKFKDETHAELNIAKHRTGRVDTFVLHFQGDVLRYSSYTAE